MQDSTLENDRPQSDGSSIRLERIPTPFVWTPREPVDLRVAVVGGSLMQRAHTAAALRAGGHRATPYATAEGLVQRLRSREQPRRRQHAPNAIDVVVLHGSGSSLAVVAALELLRSQDEAIPIVLVADDDAEVLEQATRLCVEGVLAPPVHPVALRAAVVAAVFLPSDELGLACEIEAF